MVTRPRCRHFPVITSYSIHYTKLYDLGDTVFLGASEYEVLGFDEKVVKLFDNAFPIINKEISRFEFNEKLKENPLNNHLLQVVEEENEISTEITEPIQIDVPDENPASADTLAPPKPKRRITSYNVCYTKLLRSLIRKKK